MKTIPISELEGSIDALLVAGREEPVEITQAGKRLGVFISDADADLIDEVLLVQKAALARAEGFIGVEASKALLDRFRNAAD
jgi:hypothetical protein